MASKQSSIGSRRQSREAALQMLYINDVQAGAGDLLPERAWSSDPLPEKVLEFARHLAAGVLDRQNILDPLITKYAENWELKRMAVVDRCILRLAAFEILYDLETPVSVIINEAVEIAKTYSTSESGKFVNGILDKIKLERRDGQK